MSHTTIAMSPSELLGELRRNVRGPARAAQLDDLWGRYASRRVDKKEFIKMAKRIAGRRKLRDAIVTLIPGVTRMAAVHHMAHAVMGTNEAALGRAIRMAEREGVDAGRLAHARGRLAVLRHEEGARGRLLKLGADAPDIPDEDDFCCPITYCRMIDPVVASDGITYERDAIEAHLGTDASVVKRSPLTREELTRELTPNAELLDRINAHYGAAWDAALAAVHASP